ncbi:MAG: tol-pal system protein YbgF [Gammaproteobacteria bacterium]|nr:tol-pal system protein YbgF [Gammaproteobacteria bacterium]
MQLTRKIVALYYSIAKPVTVRMSTIMMHLKRRKLFIATIIAMGSCVLLANTALAVPVVDVTQDAQTQQPLITDSSSTAVSAIDTASMSSEQRIARLEQMVAAQTQMQLLDRINQLQQNVEILQGQNEILRHQLQQLQDQQRKYYQDLDKRVTVLEGGKKAATAVPVATGTVPLSTLDDQTAYQNAYNLLSKQQYDQALVALQTFVKQYPKSTYVPNAIYWQAEVLSAQSKNAAAATMFQQLIAQYPTSNKVPDAKLKLALIAIENNQIPQAKQKLQEIISKYPDSSAATLATNKLRQLK